MDFFTSDLHLGHRNIMKYCDRPFETTEQMDAELLGRWNDVVTEDDYVWILGDITMRKIRQYEWFFRQALGKKILVAGNHDTCFYRNKKSAASVDAYHDLGFYDVIPSGVVWRRANLIGLGDMLGTQPVSLTHYPVIESLHERDREEGEHQIPGLDRWNLCGHVHTAWGRSGKSINVGVDVRGFAPVSAEILMLIMQSGAMPIAGEPLQRSVG